MLDLPKEEFTMPVRTNRRKISTTVAPETDDFLKSLIRRGRAANIAEAVDRAIAIARRAESRRKLEAATAAYYESLSPAGLRAEKSLEMKLTAASALVNFDGE